MDWKPGHSQRIDITYTSNAIEGNTTAGETALVVEKASSPKPLGTISKRLIMQGR